MSGLFIGLAVGAGFILGVRVGFALARRGDKKGDRKKGAARARSG
jgi:hypothetical protein